MVEHYYWEEQHVSRQVLFSLEIHRISLCKYCTGLNADGLSV